MGYQLEIIGIGLENSLKHLANEALRGSWVAINTVEICCERVGLFGR